MKWLSYLDFITNGHDQINMQHFSILSRHALKVYSKVWNQMPYYFCNELSKAWIKLFSADKLT